MSVAGLLQHVLPIWLYLFVYQPSCDVDRICVQRCFPEIQKKKKKKPSHIYFNTASFKWIQVHYTHVH